MVVDFVKYAFVISNYLRGYIALVIVAFLVCSFPWGSYGWMSYFDFRRISYEEGISMAIDTISPEDYSIPMASQTSRYLPVLQSVSMAFIAICLKTSSRATCW